MVQANSGADRSAEKSTGHRCELGPKIIARMLNGKPFTFTQICCEFKGRPVGDTSGRNITLDRLVDREIQRLRRKGKIAFTREHGAVVWRLVDREVEATSTGEE